MVLTSCVIVGATRRIVSDQSLRKNLLPRPAAPSRLIQGLTNSSGTSFSTTTALVGEQDDGNKTTIVPLDYYAILGVRRGFTVDNNLLKQSYRSLMAQYHPDLQHHQTTTTNNDDQATKSTGDIHASTITHAYHTLRKPHTRAMHLLELIGMPIDDETKTTLEASNRLVSLEFLLNIMEWREAIDELPSVSSERDNDDDDSMVRQELEKRLMETRQSMDSILQQLDTIFETEELHQAMSLVAQLQYWHRIEETIVEKM